MLDRVLSSEFDLKEAFVVKRGACILHALLA